MTAPVQRVAHDAPKSPARDDVMKLASRCGPAAVDSCNEAALTERILAFRDRYNQDATPFDWTVDRTDLDALLDRPGPPEPATLPTAARPPTS
jgi:hypothetical protein